MRKLTTILLASAVAVAGLGLGDAHAQYYGGPPAPYAPPPPPGYYHHWHHGDRWYGPRHIVYHWGYYHLPPPPPGTVWVHNGPGFVLLDPYGVVIRSWGP